MKQSITAVAILLTVILTHCSSCNDTIKTICVNSNYSRLNGEWTLGGCYHKRPWYKHMIQIQNENKVTTFTRVFYMYSPDTSPLIASSYRIDYDPFCTVCSHSKPSSMLNAFRHPMSYCQYGDVEKCNGKWGDVTDGNKTIKGSITYQDCSISKDCPKSPICITMNTKQPLISPIFGKYEFEVCDSYTNPIARIHRLDNGMFGSGTYIASTISDKIIYAFCPRRNIQFCDGLWRIGGQNNTLAVASNVINIKECDVVMNKTCSEQPEYLCVDDRTLNIVSGQYKYLKCENGMNSYAHSKSNFILQFRWDMHAYIIADNQSTFQWYCHSMDWTVCNAENKWIYANKKPYHIQVVTINISNNKCDFDVNVDMNIFDMNIFDMNISSTMMVYPYLNDSVAINIGIFANTENQQIMENMALLILVLSMILCAYKCGVKKGKKLHQNV